MTTIRRATREDVPALCALAKREHGRSRFARQPFDAEKVHASFLGAVHGLTSGVFVSETGGNVGGMIVGITQSNLFNRYTTAYELLWYAEDGAGLKLLDALKDWSRNMRAVELVVHNYAGISSPERFNKAMARKGFGHLGASYVAALES